MISDFAVFLTIVLMVLIDFVVGVPSQKLQVPSKFKVNKKQELAQTGTSGTYRSTSVNPNGYLNDYSVRTQDIRYFFYIFPHVKYLEGISSHFLACREDYGTGLLSSIKMACIGSLIMFHPIRPHIVH